MSSNPVARPRRNLHSTNPLRPSASQSRRRPRPNATRPPPSPAPVKKEPGHVEPPAPSSSPPESYTDFKLRSCSAEETKNARHHILRFHSKTPVNPATDFTPPIRFHRKDPKNMQFQLTISEMEGREKELKDASVELDRAVKEQEVKAKGQAAASLAAGIAPEPAPKADLSVIAPDGGARKINRPFQKKTHQVNVGNEAGRKLRYEEYYPWIMEDFDGKNTWVSGYEAAQSDCYALFVFDDDGFKMVPAEKFYKMTPRNKYTTLTLEEAEQRMEKKTAPSRWVMKHISEEKQQQAQETPYNSRRRFKTVDGPSSSSSSRREAADHDEIDFDEEFADDEEAPIMDGAEEDVKVVEEKIKREQRSANTIGVSNDVGDDDEDDHFDLFNNPNEPKIGKEGRKLKKYLRSLEKNANYESDEEGNPYASDEDDDDTDDDIKANTTTPKVKEELDLPSKIRVKKESQSTPPPLRRVARKKFDNLEPGMVVLQLSPDLLKTFDLNEWNPSVKRRQGQPKPSKRPLESEAIQRNGAAKKLKLKSASPPPITGNSTGASNPPGDTDENILTVEDVRRVIASNGVSTKELVALLKPKLRLHEGNYNKLKIFVREIAKIHDGLLVLKD